MGGTEDHRLVRQGPAAGCIRNECLLEVAGADPQGMVTDESQSVGPDREPQQGAVPLGTPLARVQETGGTAAQAPHGYHQQRRECCGANQWLPREAGGAEEKNQRRGQAQRHRSRTEQVEVGQPAGGQQVEPGPARGPAP